MLNKITLETDGLVVGGNQLVTSGGQVNVGNNLYVAANTVTANLTVTGTFNYPRANTNMPAMAVFSNTLTTATSGNVYNVIYDKIEFDTNNCFNPTSQWLYVNGIYTPPWSWAPNVPGYYQINYNVLFNMTNAGYGVSQLYKQNNPIHYSYFNANSAGAVITTQGSRIVAMNGISDYLSMTVLQTSGATATIGSSNQAYGFSGCWLRPL